LRAVRELRGLNQRDLAKKADMTASTISHFERGGGKPSFENLRRLADALDVATDYLVGRGIQIGATAAGDSLHRDIQKLKATDRSFAENEIQRTVARAKDKTGSLQKAQADLGHAARVTTLGELAASIVHEINQPLSSVATSGDACLRWLDRAPPDLDAARKAVVRIVQDAHRAGDVIRSLRALAMKSGPQFTPLDLKGTIQEVLALTRSDLHQRGVALQMTLDAPLPQVLGDKVQLQQVLMNLITNGMDAMADVTDRSKMLKISAKLAQPDGVVVRIEDTGTGFDPAKADQIFAPFYTTKSSGMGMGLSICKTIIEAHGGELSAKPNLPQGAIFQFRLSAERPRSN
jgi:C4-dicarboxylate-specific signal transduction histidine kinase